MTLSQEICDACRADAPAVSKNEYPNLLTEIPHWSIKTRDAIPQLERLFTFDNFVNAMAFANQVGELAEITNHHPELNGEKSLSLGGPTKLADYTVMILFWLPERMS